MISFQLYWIIYGLGKNKCNSVDLYGIYVLRYEPFLTVFSLKTQQTEEN